ncbi:MAG: hypothetical protein WAW73_06040 [Rhodoferax sp.]|jgi:hypothetical protein
MNLPKELVVSADKLRSATTALEPDSRARGTVVIGCEGSFSMVALAEQQALATLDSRFVENAGKRT